MNVFRCTVCGHMLKDTAKPKNCPQCEASALKIVKVSGKEISTSEGRLFGCMTGADAALLETIRQGYEGECREIGISLAMSRAAAQEGYPEIAEVFQRCAQDAAEHASKFAELLGDSVSPSTKRNLELRAAAQFGLTEDKASIAQRLKEMHLDHIYDVMLEMAQGNVQRHKQLENLLRRYF